MKKVRVLGLLLLMGMLIMVAGCSKTASTTTGQASKQTSDKAVTQDNSQGSAGTTQSSTDKNANAANNGNGTPGLTGKVTAVNGSSITLAVAKMPSRDSSQAQGTPPQNPPDNQNQGASPGANKEGAPSIELTGETQTITIPDGLKITTGGRDNTQELSVSSIKTGDMLQVWFTDGQTVQKVMVMQAPQ